MKEEIKTEINSKVCPACGGEMKYHRELPGETLVFRCSRCHLLARANLDNVENPLERWKMLGEAIRANWPEGLSAEEAIRQDREEE